MKQLFPTCILALALCMTAPANAQKHRHHQTVQQTAVASPDSASEGVEAFSDTTTAVTASSQGASRTASYTFSIDDDDADDFFDNPLSFWTSMMGLGIGGVLLAIFVVLLVFILLISPFIILALIIRMLIKRHNDNVTLATKAIENGQPLPENHATYDGYYWEKGVKNTAIGVGLAFMGWLWSTSFLSGIGVLIACYGLGLIYLSKHSRKKEQEEEE